MRIRKNANVSSYMNSHASGPNSFQTHVCLLNQSPWDVVPFSQHHQTSSAFRQLEDEDSFNGSLVDSIGAVESVASMIDEKSAATIAKDENYGNKKRSMLEECEEIKVETNWIKTKTSRHLKNNDNNNTIHQRESSVIISTSCAKKQEKICSSRRAQRKKGSSSNNPYEFYYYSGFGPSWGKRRGSNRVGNKLLNHDLLVLDRNVSGSPPRIEPNNSDISNNGFDDEEDEDDEDETNGKRRIRKPIKARSLKSLM